MRIIFAGTPEFARHALAALHDAGFEIPLVLTQPDRPAGRGMKTQPSPVKQLAMDLRIAVAQPRSLRLDGKYPEDARAAQDAIGLADAAAMVVAAYGLILPQWVLAAMAQPHAGGPARLGCLNIHASLLPRWRGAAPIHRAIEAGDTETGITIMQMDAGLDTGDMLLVEKLPIAPDDTTGSLHDKLAPIGGRLVVDALRLAAQGGLRPVKQPEAGVTYARKIEKHEAAIDWFASADAISRRIRAFDPSPGATAMLHGQVLKLWRGEPVRPAPGPAAGPGTVVAVERDRFRVEAGEGEVAVTQAQRPGGKRLPVAEFLRGFPLEPGMRFERAGA